MTLYQVSMNIEYVKVAKREYALYDIPKGYHPEKFELREPIDFSAHDVYKTKVYYDREQRILISPKLFKLMKNYIKDNEYKAIF